MHHLPALSFLNELHWKCAEFPQVAERSLWWLPTTEGGFVCFNDLGQILILKQKRELLKELCKNYY